MRRLSTIAQVVNQGRRAPGQPPLANRPASAPTVVHPVTNKCSVVVYDEWSQHADLFATPPPPGYGFLALRRFRWWHILSSTITEAQIWQSLGRKHSARNQSKLVADRFLSLNAAIVSGRTQGLTAVCTETLADGMQDGAAGRFPASGLGFARASGVVAPPEMLQARIIATPDAQFVQATYLVKTSQRAVEPSEHPTRRGETVDDFKARVKQPPHFHWLHAPDRRGRLYFYCLAKDKMHVHWDVPAELKIKPAAYEKRSGTLGATGKWVDDQTVQHYVTLERPLHRRDVGWRVHHF